MSCSAETVSRMKSKLLACFSMCCGFLECATSGSQPLGVFSLVGRGGEQRNVRAHRVGEFHAHVAESTQADHADLLALAHLPVA